MKDRDIRKKGCVIHQLLHGYSKGHRLLASSVELDDQDADLLLSLSDLSGSFGGSNSFIPYETFYPLHSKKFFALAKTFPDNDAPRPGCVLTHTILVPMDIWKGDGRVTQLAKCLNDPPSRHHLSSFKHSLDWNFDKNKTNDGEHIDVSAGWLQAFVTAFFEKETNPLIITGCGELASSLFWRLVSISWPNMRSSLTCCTWALEPRYLTAKKPFELMFTPNSSRSKFEWNSSHFLDSSAQVDAEFSEDWTVEITRMLQSNEGFDRGNELFKELPKERNSIRKFMVFKNLSNKSINTARAALGALDILSSLSPSASHCTELKFELVESTLHLIEKCQYVQENLETLQILSHKLIAKPFGKVSEELGLRIRLVSRQFTLMDPAHALTVLNASLASRKRDSASAFALGVVDGLSEIRTEQMLQLFEPLQAALVELPELINERPVLVEMYLSMADRLQRWHEREVLVNLIPRLDSNAQLIVFDHILPYAVRNDYGLLRKLLSTLLLSDTSKILERLEAASFFSDPVNIRSVEIFTNDHRLAVRKWLEAKPSWTEGMIGLAARTWEFSATGFNDLLAREREEYRSKVLLEYLLANSTTNCVESWLQKDLSTTASCFHLLLSVDFPISLDMENVLGRIFQTTKLKVDWRICNALLKDPLPQIFNVDGVSEAILRGVISDCTSLESCDRPLIESIMNSPFIANYVQHLATWKLREWLFADSTNVNFAAGVLEWTSLCPDNFLQDRVSDVLHFVDIFMKRSSVVDYKRLESSWIQLLERVKEICTEYQYLRFCGQGLRYSFEHNRVALSSLCSATFYPTYRAVVRKGYRTPPEIDNLFSSYTWDRGKELRKRIVDCFIDSDWPPGDLALAIPDVDLRRKIIRRLQRTWESGPKYVSRIINDLKKRECDQALITELRALNNRSGHEEDWL